MALAVVGGVREVLEFERGVRAYEPAAGGLWRLRWEERGRRRDTTAVGRAEAIAKAAELVDRLAQGTPTDLARATGAELVAHYLDPARRTPRGRPWSIRHREEQESYCRRFVVPVLGPMPCERMGRADFQTVLDAATTPSVAAHLRRCLSALVGAGLDDGYLLARQDVLRGVRWRPSPMAATAAPAWDDDLDAFEADEEAGRPVTEAEIPTADAVHALAQTTAARTGVWWRELEILLVAYSGMRWGEHVALTAAQLDAARRRIRVDRQVVQSRHGMHLALPKGRKRRTTMYPAATPNGVDLADLVERRLAETEPDQLAFPAPRGGWARRSDYGRRIYRPAALSLGWEQRPDGRLTWPFHSLRHVFATWALTRPGARLEDISRLLGHSSTRITQDLYITPDGDLYNRFYQATQ